jgi:hypothetical protein
MQVLEVFMAVAVAEAEKALLVAQQALAVLAVLAQMVFALLQFGMGDLNVFSF